VFAVNALDARAGLREVPLATRSLDALREELSEGARTRLEAARENAQGLLGGGTVWVVNSTERGGGVAEMIRTLIPYWRGDGIDARWLVMEAGPEFFRFTKRLHSLLHGVSVPRPGPRDQALFDRVARTVGASALGLVGPDDVVILEDPQTAGLAPRLKGVARAVVWRSHVGADRTTKPVEEAWRFLLPYVEAADAPVFTRSEYVPPGLNRDREVLLPPAIDPLSAKNQPLSLPLAEAILDRCGLARGERPRGPVRVGVAGGRVVEVRRRCRVLREGAPPRLGVDRLVVALARWDRLKDPVGIIHAFAEGVTDPATRLIVGGPATNALADDPEGRRVLREARGAWEALPRSRRARIDIAVLPMVDLDENALMVNALQRRAAVIVKKSLQEGFGLGVTEGMWKARPVVATRVGGHQDQIEHRRNGLLVDDPLDLSAFAAAINELLENPAEARALAAAGREQARERFLTDRHFVAWTAALRRTLGGASAVRQGQ
jgi:trehalose synthase